MSLQHPHEAVNAATNTALLHGSTNRHQHEESLDIPSPSKPYEHVLQLHHVPHSDEDISSHPPSNNLNNSDESLSPPSHTLNELLETAEHAVKDKIEVVLPDEKR
ncbi:hypothetical protein C9374_007996 [Naegleria lovaniensis]|uniref:Uncharacterized protein n=1 Tax=Naegleria lovaniensis TaxID=51637 RepID=A0AA88GMB0_NAELO|nr:uncharacterized protein C9374_007996 [Naegleria lovaniensis]KAG2378848.1 hypothetical protein C9374_007996 [Naegleria lovaniensis]